MNNTVFLVELLELSKRTAVILGVAWLAVVIAMAVDLVAGVRKAQMAGIARTSYGFRRTIDKLGRYGTGLLFTLIADAIMLVGDVYSSPYASVLLSCALVFIEGKSWFEKLEEKDRSSIKDSLSTIAKAVATRQADNIINDLTNSNHESNTTLHTTGANQKHDSSTQGDRQPRPRTRTKRPLKAMHERTGAPEGGAGQAHQDQ